MLALQRTMAKTKLSAFRLTPDDLVILDACQDHVGVQSRSEALRAILRAYVRAEGIKLPKQPAQGTKTARAK